MFKKTLLLILSFSAMLMVAGGSQANTIDMDEYGGGGDGKVACNDMAPDACYGIVVDVNSGFASFSSTDADRRFPASSSEADELTELNVLLALFNPPKPAVMGATKLADLITGRSFITDKEFFSIKKGSQQSGGGTWYFANNTGSALTVALAPGNDTYSLWTEYGKTVVPVPAAVWLFGSGLLGLIAVARRSKVYY